MAEATAKEVEETNTTTTVDMEVENTESPQNAGGNGGSEPNGTDPATNGESNLKREREEDESQEGEDGVCKKPKLEKSVEEERLEKLEEGVQEEEKSGPVNLGYKTFASSVEIFDYFYKFLHHWPPHLNVNKYEHTMLLELLKKGHSEPDKKIGGGVRTFQIRNHPTWKSRCFFIIREDDSVDDFSFRKCVDHILPLPEEMKLKSHANKMLGGGGGKGRGRRGGGGKGGGRGRGKGGKFRR
ncbi:protein EMBRYO DEFECTIVE 514-like [Neltuma alba]|uniref:protein EMBRYO DEFECTIVE 514-like n=1 Tax=Neltuma alba TaxID=207710 RepID=UPI0010A471F1|nr:protein EMBRYO DEFECTIVE 514-like [Prosopis alba]